MKIRPALLEKMLDPPPDYAYQFLAENFNIVAVTAKSIKAIFFPNSSEALTIFRVHKNLKLIF